MRPVAARAIGDQAKNCGISHTECADRWHYETLKHSGVDAFVAAVNDRDSPPSNLPASDFFSAGLVPTLRVVMHTVPMTEWRHSHVAGSRQG